MTALPQLPDQSPDTPGTALALRLVSLASYLGCQPSRIELIPDAPHLFHVTDAGHYAVTERMLDPIPPGLRLLGRKWGYNIFEIK